MNLKDAFRYQKQLGRFYEQMVYFLAGSSNVTKTVITHQRSKVLTDKNDESIDMSKDRKYANFTISKLIDFAIGILNEKQNLSKAIDDAKRSTDFCLDSQIAMNILRQQLAGTLTNLGSISPTERQSTGRDYVFNQEGNQVSYTYPTLEVTTIDFDRNEVKGLSKKLLKESDEVSSTVDRIMLDLMVEFTPRFDFQDTLEDALEKFYS